MFVCTSNGLVNATAAAFEHSVYVLASNWFQLFRFATTLFIEIGKLSLRLCHKRTHRQFSASGSISKPVVAHITLTLNCHPSRALVHISISAEGKMSIGPRSCVIYNSDVNHPVRPRRTEADSNTCGMEFVQKLWFNQIGVIVKVPAADLPHKRLRKWPSIWRASAPSHLKWSHLPNGTMRYNQYLWEAFRVHWIGWVANGLRGQTGCALWPRERHTWNRESIYPFHFGSANIRINGIVHSLMQSINYARKSDWQHSQTCSILAAFWAIAATQLNDGHSAKVAFCTAQQQQPPL